MAKCPSVLGGKTHTNKPNIHFKFDELRAGSLYPLPPLSNLLAKSFSEPNPALTCTTSEKFEYKCGVDERQRPGPKQRPGERRVDKQRPSENHGPNGKQGPNEKQVLRPDEKPDSSPRSGSCEKQNSFERLSLSGKQRHNEKQSSGQKNSPRGKQHPSGRHGPNEGQRPDSTQRRNEMQRQTEMQRPNEGQISNERNGLSDKRGPDRKHASDVRSHHAGERSSSDKHSSNSTQQPPSGRNKSNPSGNYSKGHVVDHVANRSSESVGVQAGYHASDRGGDKNVPFNTTSNTTSNASRLTPGITRQPAGNLQDSADSIGRTLHVIIYKQCGCCPVTVNTTNHWALWLAEADNPSEGTLYHSVSFFTNHETADARAARTGRISRPTCAGGYLKRLGYRPSRSTAIRGTHMVATGVFDRDVHEAGRKMDEEHPYHIATNNCQNWVIGVLQKLRNDRKITVEQYNLTAQRITPSLLANWGAVSFAPV
jgi:hypothetical protein